MTEFFRGCTMTEINSLDARLALDVEGGNQNMSMTQKNVPPDTGGAPTPASHPAPSPASSPAPSPVAPPVASRPSGPRGRKSALRIQQILAGARAVLSEHGYQHATAAEIARRAGVSEASVFTYFRSKRELCLRVIADWYDEIIAAMEAALPRDQPLQRQFEVFVRTHLRLFLVQGTGLCALVLSEGREQGQDLGPDLLPLQRRYTATLMQLLAQGRSEGLIRSDVPLRLLRPMVLGPIEHLLWEAVAAAQGSAPSADPEAIARDLVPMLWSAIAAPDAERVALRRLREELAAALARC